MPRLSLVSASRTSNVIVGWLLAAASIGACVGDAAEPGGASVDAGSSPSPDAATSSSSGAAAPDACAAACTTATTLRTCDGAEVECALACTEQGGARCAQFDPPGSITANDVAAAEGTADLGADFASDESKIPLVLDADTGRIFRPAVARDGGLPERIVREPNADPAVAEVLGGIRFERRSDLAVFSARDLTLRNSRIIGTIPVAFVAGNELRVLGRVETECGQVGGQAGGGSGESGAGAGGGAPGLGSASTTASGAGGGGHAGPGGAGANGTLASAARTGGNGGVQVDFSASTLLGGSGGGGAGNRRGGAGGGVIVMVAGSSIQMGDDVTTQWFPPEADTERTLFKGVDVGGCGGGGGGGSTGGISGAGGGAGGIAWIESPSVLLRTKTGVAANGGGGGGTVSAGPRSDIVDAPTPGGSGVGNTCAKGGGGAGGGGATMGGRNGTADPHPTCTTNNYGGGGGGGGGHIRIRTRTGLLSESSAGIMSPSPAVSLGALEPR